MADIFSILKSYWGYNSFRSLQEEIINTVLERKDCLALLPTGGGKSLCFQVPALAMDGVCLVISPLIALMKDQVQNLRKRNITAFSVHAGMNWKEVKHTLQVAGNSNCKFLYVSPERLETRVFKEYLLSLNIRLIAVDEAHCISQWGYDFRPSYLRISALREELPGVPVLALTASATPDVQQDICDKLLFSKHHIFRQSFERSNLSYSVNKTSSKINRISDILSKVEGAAIVYCKSRKRTKELSDLLNLNGTRADYYHAGLSQEKRNEKQEAWLKNHTRVIVCTNAFGMGIDKPDVRIVIHADVPDCLENYYQEAGRAGRDGRKSYAVLLYTDHELKDLATMLHTRFPPVGAIRKIYKSLMNVLQVPAGSGEGNYYEFDPVTFSGNFGLNITQVLSALKTLEQEKVLYFTEQVFVPSKIEVTAGREVLRSFEKEHAMLDPLLKTLLRTYEGIIDREVDIHEKTIAALCRLTVDEIVTQLHRLHTMGVIRYIPQKDKPQIYIIENRVIADDLQIDPEKYRRRKEVYENRLKKMTEYVYDTNVCRSVMIGKYFGDEKISNCGICDNCLARKKTEMSESEFNDIQQRIMSVTSVETLTLNELMNRMNGFPREKTRDALRFLQAEEKVFVDKSGRISSKP